MNVDLFGVTVPLPPFGQLVFLPIAGLAIISALAMITRKNAVHSALWLVVTFFQLAIMYVMLGAEFLAVLQVLVYTGAILVLFLFVIMLLNLREGPKLGGVHLGQVIVAWPIGLLLAAELAVVTLFTNVPNEAHIGDIIGDQNIVFSQQQQIAMGGNVIALGQTLYTQFLYPFEIASLILLLAVVGAIVLARKEEPAEVEEIMPALGISIGRRSISGSSQETQIEKKLLPDLGVGSAPDASTGTREIPTVTQPSGIGRGTTSGVDAEPAGAGRGK